MSLNSDQLWLLSPAADPHLEFARSELARNGNLLKILERLRKSISPTQAAMTIELAQLRLRAQEKFPFAHQMFLTTRGLEQATSAQLAAYKAEQLPAGRRILDLCSGIGGDLAGFARLHESTGVDLDPLLCQYAQRNAELAPGARARVLCQSALETSWEGYDLVHIDPDRRVNQRSTDHRFIQPTLAQVLEQAGKVPVVIKLAPGMRLPDGLKPLAHRQWLGERRECKQLLVWLNTGGRKPLGRKSATVVLGDGTSCSVVQSRRKEANAPHHRPAPPEPGSYFYEPHAAVLAARLVDSLASEFDLERATRGVAYLCGPEPIDSPLLSGFRVLSVAPAEKRILATELRLQDAGVVEWKKRGVHLQLYESLRQIRTAGKRPLTALLMPHRNKFICVIAERLERPQSPTPNSAAED